jgi:hypothetical protein
MLNKWFRKTPTPPKQEIKEPDVTFQVSSGSVWTILALVGTVLLGYGSRFLDWFGQTESPRGKLNVDDVMAAVRAGLSMSLAIFLAKVLEGLLPFVNSIFLYVILAVIITLIKKIVATGL